MNEKTIEDKYPLPRIDEILYNLGKCVYFATLDLAQEFHQIEMSQDSIEKTEFSVNNGLRLRPHAIQIKKCPVNLSKSNR